MRAVIAGTGTGWGISNLTIDASNVPGVTGIYILGAGQVQDIEVTNADDAGIKVHPKGRLKSRGLRSKNNRIGVDNAGEFDGPDTVFK